MNHHRPWLNYVKANDASNRDVDFDEMPVESPTGEKLGAVDGFIVDSDSARPYYVVVDAGSWFKSKYFLLPIGHATLDASDDRDALVADLARERVDRFPGFDKDEFDALTPESIKRLNDQICTACGTTMIEYKVDEAYDAAWDRPDFSYPNWWEAGPSRSDRMGAAQKEMADPSPHFDGRAQPGDVIGLETGGERTYVGDTANDENKRREKAERAARKQ